MNVNQHLTLAAVPVLHTVPKDVAYEWSCSTINLLSPLISAGTWNRSELTILPYCLNSATEFKFILAVSSVSASWVEFNEITISVNQAPICRKLCLTFASTGAAMGDLPTITVTADSNLYDEDGIDGLRVALSTLALPIELPVCSDGWTASRSITFSLPLHPDTWEEFHIVQFIVYAKDSLGAISRFALANMRLEIKSLASYWTKERRVQYAREIISGTSQERFAVAAIALQNVNRTAGSEDVIVEILHGLQLQSLYADHISLVLLAVRGVALWMWSFGYGGSEDVEAFIPWIWQVIHRVLEYEVELSTAMGQTLLSAVAAVIATQRGHSDASRITLGWLPRVLTAGLPAGSSVLLKASLNPLGDTRATCELAMAVHRFQPQDVRRATFVLPDGSELFFSDELAKKVSIIPDMSLVTLRYDGCYLFPHPGASSAIISISINQIVTSQLSTAVPVQGLQEPIQFSLSSVSPIPSLCAAWNEDRWETQGLTSSVGETTGTLVCFSSHLSDFTAVPRPPTPPAPQLISNRSVLNTLEIICICAIVIIVIVCMIVFVLCWLRRKQSIPTSVGFAGVLCEPVVGSETNLLRRTNDDETVECTVEKKLQTKLGIDAKFVSSALLDAQRESVHTPVSWIHPSPIPPPLQAPFSRRARDANFDDFPLCSTVNAFNPYDSLVGSAVPTVTPNRLADVIYDAADSR